MAITINSQPDSTKWWSIYNPVYYTVSSTNTGQPNFKFVADIYVNGVFKLREKHAPDPVYLKGDFEVNRIAESFLNFSFDPTIDTFTHAPNNYGTLQVKFGEEYGTTPVVYPDLTLSNTVTILNSSRGFIEHMTTSMDDYTDISLNRKALTSKGSNFRMFRGQNDYMYITNDVATSTAMIQVRTFDYTRTLIQSFRLQNTLVGGTDKVVYVPIGYNLNNALLGDIIAGALPVYDSNVKYAEITFREAGGLLASSQIYNLEFNDNCQGDDEYDIVYQNRLGGFETFRFTKLPTKSISISKKEYRQNFLRKNNSGNLSETISDRGSQTFFTSTTDEWTLRTDWLNDEETNRLTELVESPQLFLIYDSSFNMFAVNTAITNYEKKTVKKGELIQFELSLKFSNNNYRQRY